MANPYCFCLYLLLQGTFQRALKNQVTSKLDSIQGSMSLLLASQFSVSVVLCLSVWETKGLTLPQVNPVPVLTLDIKTLFC